MNIFSKITFQSLMKNRTRTIVTIIGVILSAAMITAVTTFISSLQEYLLRDAIKKYGVWDVLYDNVDVNFYEEVKSDSRVKDAFLVETVGVGLLNPEDIYSSVYFLSGFSEKAFETLPITMLSGRLPENENEIVIPYGVGPPWIDYAIGDTITMEYASGRNATGAYCQCCGEYTPDTIKKYAIVGFCDSLWHALNFRTFITAKADVSPTGNYIVYAQMKNSRDVYNFSEELAKKLGDDVFLFTNYNREYLRFIGVSENDNFYLVIYSLGAVLIALIMVGSVLLIYNAFAISVSERTRQFGILSSVGATGKQLRKSVLFEGLCVGAIGIPLGVLAGIAGIGITLNAVAEILGVLMSGSTNPLSLSVSWQAVVVAAAVGIVTIMISAYIPASRASKKSAIDSIRQSSDIKISAKKIRTSKIYEKLLGVEGMLSRKNFKRNKKRYRSTIVSLFVSVVLFVSAGSFGLYLKEASAGSIQTSNCDVRLFFFRDDLGSQSHDEIITLYAMLQGADDVYASSYQFIYNSYSFLSSSLYDSRYLDDRYKWEEDKVNHENYDYTIDDYVILMFLDDEAYLAYLAEINLSEREYMGEVSKLPAYARIQRFNRETSRYENLDIFNVKSLEFKLYFGLEDWETPVEETGHDVSLTLVDKMPNNIASNHISQMVIFAPYSQMDKFDLPEGMYLSGNISFLSYDSFATVEHIERILDETEYSGVYKIDNAYEQEESNRRIIYVLNIFIYGFIILMSLITVANVFNTITTSVNLRRREFAMLKSTGMTDGGLNKMVIFECMFYGIRALLFGLPVSVFVSWLIYEGVMQGVDVDFMLPWDSIIIAIAGVFSIVLVTMMYAVGKVKRENIIDTLRSEIV